MATSGNPGHCKTLSESQLVLILLRGQGGRSGGRLVSGGDQVGKVGSCQTIKPFRARGRVYSEGRRESLESNTAILCF